MVCPYRQSNQQTSNQHAGAVPLGALRRLVRLLLPLLSVTLTIAGLLMVAISPAQSQSSDKMTTWRQVGPEQAAVGDLLTYRYLVDSPAGPDETVVLTVDLSTNLLLTRLRSGWFLNQQGQDQPVDMVIRYRTGRGNWQTWAEWRDVSRQATRFLLVSDLNLPPAERIRQLQIEIQPSATGLRSVPTLGGRLAFDALLLPAGQALLPGDEIRSCATFDLAGSAAFRPLTACSRTTIQPLRPDIALGLSPSSPEPFTPGENRGLTFSLIENSFEADGVNASWLPGAAGIILPAGFEVITDGWTIDSPLSQAEITIKVSPLPSGERLVSWGWGVGEPIVAGSSAETEDHTSAGFTIRLRVAVSSTLPAGRYRLQAVYLPPAEDFLCWGIHPGAVDTYDLDGDGRRREPLCTLTLTVDLDGQAPDDQSPAPFVPEGSPGFDFSDGPEPFPVAWHQIVPGVSLGLIVDEETEAATSFAADGDDRQGLSDEDGILFANDGVGITGRQDNGVTVVLLNRGAEIVRLHGWVDFNRDGLFGDDERIIFGHRFAPATNPQAHRFEFPIPAGALCGPTLARFRLSPDTTRPDGGSAAGEVEDIAYRIDCVADISVAAFPRVETIGWEETLHWVISATNQGPSTAQGVVITQTIHPDVGYLDHTFPSRTGWRCSSDGEISASGLLICRLPLIEAGETVTIDLSVVVPRRYPAVEVTQTVDISTATPDNNLRNNRIVGSVPVDKRWVLDERTLRSNFVFVHAAYDPNLTDNPALRERDFRLSQPIPNIIQVPISLSVGYHTGQSPQLTVPSCLADPADLTCNDNNRIVGQYILENYAITSVIYAGEAVFQPSEPETVFLNRISDANMSRCAGRGSCVGYDLFQVERGGVTPYAWQEPFDYFYVNFVTKGGRDVSCPEEYTDRCIIINDARPGIYAINGTVQLVLAFEDVRLPDDTLVRRARPIPFTAVLQLLAPFVEPER